LGKRITFVGALFGLLELENLGVCCKAEEE
jgi:hypothetical protein